MKLGKCLAIVLALVALSLIGVGINLSQKEKRLAPSISIEQVENDLVQFVKVNYQVNLDSISEANNHAIKVTLQSLHDNHDVDISSFTSKYPCDLDHTYVLIEINEKTPIYHPHLSCTNFE